MARQRQVARNVSAFARFFDAIVDNIRTVIQGTEESVRLALVCMVAEGHLLIEDVPGVGKTTLAKALAQSLEAEWHRIQFTPDLLPSDVTGVTVYNRNKGTFDFRPGGVFANVVLGDEINRASPKTQSALLEAMEEGQVTVDAKTYRLPRPFMVIATQNPIEHEGTYPLPDSQLDRFLMRIHMGYPARDAEITMLDTHGSSDPFETLSPVATCSSRTYRASARPRSRRRSRRRSTPSGTASSSRPTSCRPTSPARRCLTSAPASSTSGPARRSRT